MPLSPQGRDLPRPRTFRREIIAADSGCDQPSYVAHSGDDVASPDAVNLNIHTLTRREWTVLGITARLLAMFAPIVVSALIGFFGGYGPAATTLASVFVVGILAVLFLPETKGKPLPA
jgi:hypothetical protein